jgi:UDP-2,3-diacylglucosamine pyrophosphatase LpxH
MDTTVRVLGPHKFDRHGNHEIPVEDADGRLSDLRVWSKHHGQVEWRVGSTYELEGVKRNPVENNNARYETAANTQIFRVGRPQTPGVNLLHVSDTHLGRPLTDEEHMGNANQLERFLDAVNLAVTSRVDAIILSGDIFDDDVDEATVQIVEEHVELLADAGIPIYYVRGNHGCDRGDAFVRSQTEAGRMIHLSNVAQLLGEGSLALYGIDADTSATSFSEAAPAGDAPRELAEPRSGDEYIGLPTAGISIPVVDTTLPMHRRAQKVYRLTIFGVHRSQHGLTKGISLSSSARDVTSPNRLSMFTTTSEARKISVNYGVTNSICSS